MIVRTTRSPLSLLAWQRTPLLVFGLVGVAFVGLRRFTSLGSWFEISPTPLAILGSGLGIFVGFRTNNAYARWWDARRLWGGLVNASRMLATQLASYLPWEASSASAVQRRAGLLVVTYVHALRVGLRDQSPGGDPDLERLFALLFTTSERESLRHEPSLPHAILDRAHRLLAEEVRSGRLTSLAMTSMDRSIGELLDCQGGAERIKRTPMPPAYGLIAHHLTMWFGLAFPLALHDDLDLWVVPMNMLVAGAFLFVNELGRVLEDPFTMFWNGLPLTALCRTIEANVRARLELDGWPSLEGADADGVLM